MIRQAFIACLAGVAVAGTARAQPAPGAQPSLPPPAPVVDADDPGVRITDKLPGITPDPNPGAVAQAVRQAPEPPEDYAEWTVEGELTEPRETVIAFLDAVVSPQGTIDAAQRRGLEEYCLDIGYELLAVEFEPIASGRRAVLVLAPVTLIRRIEIQFDDDLELNELLPWPPWEIFAIRGYWLAEFGLGAWQERGERIIEKVFKDDLVRRMGLRRGARLERDPIARREQLADAAARIRQYLQNEGYFDAKVEIAVEPEGDHAVRLVVAIHKGERYRIGAIKVRGNEAVSDREIASQFYHGRLCAPGVGCLREPRFSRQTLNRDIERVVKLYQRRGFPAVRVTTDFDIRQSPIALTKTVEFTVLVNERRKLDVVFEGNSPGFPEDTLKEQLTFDEEGSSDDVEVEASAAAIRRYYQTRGYFQASVAWQRERFRFFERVVFSIDEGPQLEVRQVAFEGNRAVSGDALRSVVSTRTYSRLFGSGGFVTSLQIEQDVERIRDHYRTLGYADVAVRARLAPTRAVTENAAALAATVASGAAVEGLYVRFLIDEGTRYTISELNFSGADPARADELASATGLRVGAPFHDEMIEEARKKLERYYFRRAHPRAKVRTPERAIRVVEPGRVSVTFDICERRPIQFGKMLIRGNFKTADWVIAEELGWDENAPLTLGRAERGQQSLRTSGLFNSVQVDFVRMRGSDDNRDADRAVWCPEPRTEEPRQVHVVVNVRERYDHKAQLEFAGGYSSDNGVIVESAMITPNIAGWGLRNDLRFQSSVFDTGVVSAGEQFLSLENKLIVPQWIAQHTLGLRFRSEATAFVQREDTERFGQLTSFGGSVALSLPLSKQTQVLLRYDLRQRNRDEDLIRGAGVSDDISKAPLGTRTGALGVQAVYDARKNLDGQLNPLTPETGFRLEARALLADRLLGGQDRFVKLGGSGQHFWKLGERVLISNGVRYDHGVPLAGDVALPEVERFFAGGDTTVRGFEEDRLATEVIALPLPPLGQVEQLRVVPAGGNIRFIHNLDFQIVLWRPRGIPVASALFLDSGIITNSLSGLEFADLRHAVGIALARVVVPFGSISAEYALPLDPQLGDDPRGRFHFNFGLLF